MGDWCGSAYADREPKKRNNECGTGIKRGCAVMEIRLMDSQKLLQSEVKVFVNPSRLKRKKV
jgi:hypothetical protein